MSSLADVKSFAEKYPYIPRRDLVFWINNANCKYNHLTLENRLQLVNKVHRYITQSKPGDITDEPRRRDDLLRDRNVIVDALMIFPTDVCQIIFDYAIMSHNDIITKILSDTADIVQSAQLQLTYNIYNDNLTKILIVDPFDNTGMGCISLRKKSAKVFDDYQGIIVQFAKGHIKNQAIHAANTIAFSHDIIAIIVQIVLMWRSYTM